MAKVNKMDPAQQFICEAMSRNQSMDAAVERGNSTMQQFYFGTTVFVTGGSGFLGKGLIEKLLRATKISKVYMLLRPKKGNDIEERLKAFIDDSVFDEIREQQPGFADKIIPIAGDVAELRLGMTDQDWNNLSDQVNIIFHLAATTRFDTPLRLTTMINIRGAREVLLLGKACKKLKSYVHVSTAFTQACPNRVNSKVLEEFYKSPMNPETMIQLAESIEESRLDAITPGLTNNWINNYSFSKAVAEDMVRTMSDELPVCVVRPAIVLSSLSEPQPGWMDISNIHGPSGHTLGIGMGVIHVSLYNDDVILDCIPVDYVSNATLAAAWATAMNKTSGGTNPKIYALTTSTRNPLVWGDVISTMRDDIVMKYPSPMAIAYSLYRRTGNPAIFWMYTWLLHLIPAYIIDGVCSLIGKEKRFVKLYRKAYKFMKAVSLVTCNNFEFADDNTEALYNSLSETDQVIFNFDVKNLNWSEFLTLWVLGLRKYILKDGLTRTEYAKKKVMFLKGFTYTAFALYFFLLYTVLSLLFVLLKTIVY